jgi:hypothetical protein
MNYESTKHSGKTAAVITIIFGKNKGRPYQAASQFIFRKNVFV